MTIVKNNTPILKRDGSPAENHVVRVYRRDTGDLLISTATAGGIGITRTESWLGDRNSTGWETLTLRMVVNQTILQPGNRVRFRLAAPSTTGATIASMYVGVSNPLSVEYDFEVPPTQVLFGGSATVALPVSTDVVSDWTPFTYLANRNLIVSVTFSGVSTVRALPAANEPMWNGYYTTGNLPNALGVSGWTSGSNIYLIDRVEINDTTVAPGYYIAYCGSFSGDVNVVCLDETGLANDLILKSATI